VRPTERGVERRAELVREDREELVLGAARLLGLLPPGLFVNQLRPRFLGFRPLGDVVPDAHHANGPRGRVDDDPSRGVQHPHSAVANHAVIECERPAVGHRPPHGGVY